jgi:hypothetical protein
MFFAGPERGSHPELMYSRPDVAQHERGSYLAKLGRVDHRATTPDPAAAADTPAAADPGRADPSAGLLVAF